MVVIGSGPGGYVAAIKAAQLGLKVRLSGSHEILPDQQLLLIRNRGRLDVTTAE